MFGLIGSVLGGLLSSSASRSAAGSQSRAAADQLAFNKEVYADQKAAFAPYQQSGLQGQQAYNALLGIGTAPEGFRGYEQSPGYQFALNQGLDAAKSAAAAHGGIGSGSTLQALNDYGHGMANQDYQTYLNRLQGIGAQGQSAAGMQANAAQQYGQNGLAAIGSQGDARASGIIGGTNGLVSGINGAIGSYGYMQGAGTTPSWLTNIFGGAKPQSNSLGGGSAW